MRKFLVFLVLFGAGLAILAWLEESVDPGADSGTGGTGRPELPLAPGEGLILRGRSKATFYDPDTARAVLLVESRDTATEGGVDRLLDTTIVMLEDDGQTHAAKVTAREARLHRIGGEGNFQPDYENRAELDDVEAVFFSGVPFKPPLRVSSPGAVVDAVDPNHRKLESTELIEFHSAELDGGGKGYLIDIDQELIELRQAGWVELRRPGEASVRLTSGKRGLLSIQRDADDAVVLFARDGASLELFGERDSSLTAESIRMRGTQSGPDRTLMIRDLEAEGTVVWTYGPNEFHCERATMEFEQGTLVHARLERTPSARLTLQLDEQRIQGLPPEELRVFTVYGNEIIELFREEGTRFTVDGPAEVETRGFRLRSNGELTGLLSDDETEARFKATGGVVVEGELATLETADFELVSSIDASGAEILSGSARGGARVVGTLENGRAFTVTSPDRLDIERRGTELHIVEAFDVDISVDGPDGFRAHAERVRDFRVKDLAFTAEGAVVFESDDGRGRGEHLVLHGPGHFTLRGTPEAKATFQGPLGSAEALMIEKEETRIHARGGVVADVVSLPEDSSPRLEGIDFDRYHLEGEDVLLDRYERQIAGTTETVFRLQAQGDVRSRVVTGAQTIDLRHAERLEAERIERFDGEVSDANWIESISLLHAEEDVEIDLTLQRGTMHLACDRVDVDRRAAAGSQPSQEIVARGNVRFRGKTDIEFRGTGEILTLDAENQGRLEAPVAGQVEFFGILPSQDTPFRLTAERVDFSSDQIEAEQPQLFFRNYRARSRHMIATNESVEFIGAVRMNGSTHKAQPWTLHAGRLRLLGRAATDPKSARLSGIDASGGIEFRLGQLIVARGDRLSKGRTTGHLLLTGSPAQIEAPLVDYEAEWIEFDPELQIVIATGPGRIRPQPASATNGTSFILLPAQEGAPEWTLEFLSSSTLVEPDSLIYVLQEPIFRYPGLGSTMRASWSVLWIDRQRWQELPEELREGETVSILPAHALDVGGPMRVFYEFLNTTKVGDLVREAYFEGPVEVLSGEDVVAHADAIYLDLVSGHGWLANATINIVGKLVGQEFKQIQVKADWLRHSTDGSLVADSATVTPCEFDEPHVRIVTGDLTLKPAPGRETDRFEVDLRDNRIELYNLPKIPLPSISFDTDEELRPLWPSISIGNSARFGSLLGMEFSGPADGVTNPVRDLFDGKRRHFKSHYLVDAKYLGSRGGLLDLGLQIESKDRYWIDAFLGIVYDDGRDKGYVRVLEDDRDTLRLWLRSQGTFLMGKSRLNFAFTDQSDLGVQSEFYESDFVNYDQQETYVEWNRTSDENFLEATVKWRTDGFRTDVEELPSGLVFRGRSPLFHLGPYPVVHTGDAQAVYLRRREGGQTTVIDGIAQPLSDPFGLPARFPDGLGNRETLRFDTRQDLEVPVPLGFLGLKLTPFSFARLTGWSEAVDQDRSASRFAAVAGARLGTTFWKRNGDGSVDQIAPYVQYGNELAFEQNEAPVTYDEVELAVSGNFIELGLRGRQGLLGGKSRFDLDLKGVYASDRSDGRADGWLPIEVFGRVELEGLGRLFEIWLDGRYDVEVGETVYSLAALGTRLGDRAGLALGHRYGLDDARRKIFDAITVAGFYRWTDKWEFEASQTFSLLDDVALGLGLVVRRFGHDLIFEMEIDVREGEGTSVGFKFQPRIGHKPSRIGDMGW